MDTAVDRYMTASEANDIDGLVATLAPDAELSSPIAASMVFRGHEDLRLVFAAIYGSLSEVRWHDKLSDGRRRVLLGKARIGPVTVEDAMFLEVADDGRIRRIKPHLRPWFAITLLALNSPPASLEPQGSSNAHCAKAERHSPPEQPQALRRRGYGWETPPNNQPISTGTL